MSFSPLLVNGLREHSLLTVTLTYLKSNRKSHQRATILFSERNSIKERITQRHQQWTDRIGPEREREMLYVWEWRGYSTLFLPPTVVVGIAFIKKNSILSPVRDGYISCSIFFPSLLVFFLSLTTNTCIQGRVYIIKESTSYCCCQRTFIVSRLFSKNNIALSLVFPFSASSSSSSSSYASLSSSIGGTRINSR